MSEKESWLLLAGLSATSAAALLLLLLRSDTGMLGGTAEDRADARELRRALALLRAGKYCRPLKCRTIRADGRRGLCRTTFENKTDAAQQLLQENPALASWIERLGEPRYRAWVRAGRRGPKPMPGQRERGLDALDVRWDLRGRNRVGTWTEALYRTLPSTRRWRDLPERLAFFDESVAQAGFRRGLAPPQPLVNLLIADRAVADCEERLPDRRTLQQKLARLQKQRKHSAVPF